MTTKMQPLQPPQVGGASFSLSWESPSFTTYSSENIADIAARVVKELNLSHEDPYDDEFYPNSTSNDAFHGVCLEEDTKQSEDDEESEFEFAILNSSPISADEIFSNGQIKPMFPVFNTDLLYNYNYNYNYNHGVDGVGSHDVSSSETKTLRLPLRKLLEDRETRNNKNDTVSSSSSESDDLEGVPPGTYCVWTPKKKQEDLKMRKKSKSTGFPSKRWRFMDLLHRSNSDGKDTFVFLTPANNKKAIGNGVGDGKKREKTVMRKSTDNGNGNGNGKKKSYLPYRQDLVGFFANVNGISRTVRPF